LGKNSKVKIKKKWGQTAPKNKGGARGRTVPLPPGQGVNDSGKGRGFSSYGNHVTRNPPHCWRRGGLPVGHIAAMSKERKKGWTQITGRKKKKKIKTRPRRNALRVERGRGGTAVRSWGKDCHERQKDNIWETLRGGGKNKSHSYKEGG